MTVADLAEWPDAEECVLDVLADLVPDGHNGTVTPATLAAHLPFIRVTLYGGGDDNVTDVSRIDVDVFAATIAQAKDIAGKARQRLLGKPHLVDGGLLDRVGTDTKPHEVQWSDNAQIRRVTAAYSVSARR